MEKHKPPKIKESQEYPKIMYFKVKEDFNLKQILNEIDYYSEEITFVGMLGEGNDNDLIVRKFSSMTVGAKSEFSKDTTNQFMAPTLKFRKGKKVPPANSSELYEIIDENVALGQNSAYIAKEVYKILQRRRPLIDELNKPLYERYVKVNRFVYNSAVFTLYTASFKMDKETISEVTTCVVELSGVYAENAFKPFEWMDDRIEPKYAYSTPKEFCIARLYNADEKVKNYFIVNKFGELVEEPGEFFTVNFIVEDYDMIKPQRVPELGLIKDISKGLKREDYVFGGWYTDPEFTNEFDVETPVESDLTLYCKWLEVFDVIFFIDKYTSKTDSNVVVRHITEGEYLDKELIPVCTLENHTFKWVDKSTGEEVDIYNVPVKVTTNLVFSAVWTENEVIQLVDVADNARAIVANGAPITLHTSETDWSITRDDSERTVITFSDLDMEGKDILFIIGGGYGTDVKTSRIRVVGENVESKLPYVIQVVGGGCGYDADHVANVNKAIVTMDSGSLRSISGGGLGFSKTGETEVTVNNGYISVVFGGGVATDLIPLEEIVTEGTTNAEIITMAKNKEIESDVNKAVITINAGNVDYCIGGGDYGYTGNTFININAGNVGRLIAASILLGYVSSAVISIDGSANILEYVEMVNQGAIDKCKLIIDGNPSIGNDMPEAGILGGIYAGAFVTEDVAGTPEEFENASDSEFNIREVIIQAIPSGGTSFDRIKGIYTDRDKYYLSKSNEYVCTLEGLDNYVGLNPEDYTLKVEPEVSEEDVVETPTVPDTDGETTTKTPEENTGEGEESTEETTPDTEVETPDGDSTEETPEDNGDNSVESGEGSEDTDVTTTETPEEENP